MLTLLDDLSSDLLALRADELHRALPGPALAVLPGRRGAPLFVSVLLHGNEDTGWNALRDLLARHAGRPLPRTLAVLIGNVTAAAARVRRLDGQPDYNRIWPGGDLAHTAEAAMAREVVARIAALEPFAAIDIHNNTGLNPHYACVNRTSAQFLHLARLYSRIGVYFTRPTGVASAAFAVLCPAVALECGQPGHPDTEAAVADYVDGVLHLDSLEAPRHALEDLELHHTIGIVRVPGTTAFSFDGSAADLEFEPGIDRLNFRELPAGTVLGRVRGPGLPLEVRDDAGSDLAARWFEVRDGRLRTREQLTPAMLTTDPRAVRLDCLCYLMERWPVGRTD